MGLYDTQALHHLRESEVARVGLLESIHGKTTNSIYRHFVFAAALAFLSNLRFELSFPLLKNGQRHGFIVA
jgi:hypothetical protein